MNSPFNNLRESFALPSLVLKYAHVACIARGDYECLQLCLRLDDRDDDSPGPMEKLHDKLSMPHFRDLQHCAKQYIREHL